MRIITLLLSCTFLATSAFAESLVLDEFTDLNWTGDRDYSGNAYGITANGENAPGSWIITTDSNVSANENSSRGIWVTLGGLLKIIGNGNNELETNASENNGFGIVITRKGVMDIKDMNITANDNTWGISSTTESVFNIQGNDNWIISNNNARNDSHTGGGLATDTGGKINITGMNINVDDNIWGIGANDNSEINITGLAGSNDLFINNNAKFGVYLSGESKLNINNMNIYASGNNLFSLALGSVSLDNTTVNISDESLLAHFRSILDYYDAFGKSTFSATNSNLMNPIVTDSTDGIESTVKLTNTVWSNIGRSNITNYIASNANIYLNRGDLLTVEGSSSGDTTLHISDNYELVESSVLVVDQSAAASANADFSIYGGMVDSGVYQYFLVKGGENNWYLRSDGSLSDGARGIGNVPVLQYSVVKTGMNELRKRLGELRDNSSEVKNGAWVRTYAKHLNVDEFTSTDMDLYGIEGGYDYQIYADCDNKVFAGVMAGYLYSDDAKTNQSNGFSGKTDVKTPSVGAYAAWLNSDGWFADATVREFWVNMDANSFTAQGQRLSVEPDRAFSTASLEFGRQIKLDDFVLEPKAELQYMYSDKESFKTNNGRKVYYDETQGFSTRIAMLAGYKKELENGSVLRPFAEVAYVKEWSGTTDLTYAGAGQKSTLNGDGIELSIGLNAKVNNAFNLYSDVTYETGNVLESVAGNVGVRWSF